jgi:hypothetical protein
MTTPDDRITTALRHAAHHLDDWGSYEAAEDFRTRADRREEPPPAVCPTPCDDTCLAECHEEHLVFWKRSHKPEDCPGRKPDESD